MKLIAIAAASAFIMLGTAHAQQASSPLYGELGYTFGSAKGNGVSANPGAVRGIIGYDVHPYFGVEGMVGFGTNSDSDNGVEVKLQHMYGVYVKPKYDFGNIEAFGRLGFARVKGEACGATGCSSSSDHDFSYGLGVNYRLNPKMHVGVDWMRYQDRNGVKIDGVTVGVGYRF